jgi:hypothetical protein
MALSRDYTAIDLWREAIRDMGDAANVLQFEKFDLVNRAVKTIAGQFYDLMANAYMTEAYATLYGASKYADGHGGGTYTAATRTVSINNPSADLADTDTEDVVMIRIGADIFLGTIESVTNIATFVFKSQLYPSADGTVDEVLICGTTLSAGVVPLAGLRIMRTGENIRIELKSSIDGADLKFATTREVDTFRGSGVNANTIIWALTGDSIVYDIGDSLTTAGTLTIRYPRVPELVVADATAIDLPDGTAIEIAILYLRGLIQRRLERPVENNESKIQTLIANLYQTFGREAGEEILKEKVLALT